MGRAFLRAHEENLYKTSVGGKVIDPSRRRRQRRRETFREARDGEHGVQFMDAAKREVFGLLEAGAFETVDE